MTKGGAKMPANRITNECVVKCSAMPHPATSTQVAAANAHPAPPHARRPRTYSVHRISKKNHVATRHSAPTPNAYCGASPCTVGTVLLGSVEECCDMAPARPATNAVNTTVCSARMPSGVVNASHAAARHDLRGAAAPASGVVAAMASPLRAAAAASDLRAPATTADASRRRQKM